MQLTHFFIIAEVTPLSFHSDLLVTHVRFLVVAMAPWFINTRVRLMFSYLESCFSEDIDLKATTAGVTRAECR